MELYYHYPKKNKKLEKLAEDALFQKLVEYLYEKQEAVILRELKVEFPEKRFEKLLDTAISFELIKREERRYTLSFPIFSNQELPDAMSKFLEEAIDLLKSQALNAQIQEINALWREWFAETDYFLATTFPIAFYEKRQAGNENLSFVHFAQEGQYEQNLVDYLLMMEHGDEIPERLADLEASIGDVNPRYLFDQFEVIFENVQSGKRVRPSIFTKALIATNVVSDDCSALLLPELTSLAGPISLKKVPVSQETEAVYQRLLTYRQLLDNVDKEVTSFYFWNHDAEK